MGSFLPFPTNPLQIYFGGLPTLQIDIFFDHGMILFLYQIKKGLLWWLSGKESACQLSRHRFDP